METTKNFRDSRVEVIKNADGVLKLRAFGVGFGSTEHRDFDGEFFTDKCDFSDDIFEVKGVNYDHLPPSWAANPYGSRVLRTQPIGKATLTETTEEGRWYEIELLKAEEYHDYFLKLIEKGLMGISTQCMPGGKTTLGNGEIINWPETAIALTVRPANADTLGKINSIAKSCDIPMYKDIEQALEEENVAAILAEKEAAEAEAEDAEAEEGDVPEDQQLTEEDVAIEHTIRIDTEGLEESVRNAAIEAVKEALRAPMEAIDNIVKSLQDAVATVSQLTDDEQFKTFVASFAPEMEKVTRSLNAAMYVATKTSEPQNGKQNNPLPGDNGKNMPDNNVDSVPDEKAVTSFLPPAFNS